VLQGDLLGGEPVEGPMAERRRRLAAEQKAAREAALPEDKYTPSTEAESPRTPEETAELEKQYIQDQQDRLNQEPRLENEPEAQADLWDVGAKKVIEDKLAQAGDIVNPGRSSTTGLFQPKRFGTANAAMAQAFEDAGVRRGLGLKDESLFPDIRPGKDEEGGTGEVFEPSKNEAIESPAQQTELPFQEDIENSKAPARKEAGMSPYAQRKARLEAETSTPAAPTTVRRGRKAAKAAPKPPEIDLDSAISKAETVRRADGGASGEHFPNGDELPFHTLPGGGIVLKDSVKPATRLQVGEHLETDNAKLAAQRPVHDFLNNAGNAWNALMGMKNASPHIQYIINRLKENPYAQEVLSKVGIRSVSAARTLASSDALDHMVRPMTVVRDGKKFSTGSLGAFDSNTNQIAIRGYGWAHTSAGQHGLNEHTIVHEILHGFTDHVLRGVEDGTITDKHVVAAVKELDTIRKALEDNKERILKDVDPRVAREFEYGLTDNHELVSVFYTDKAARNVLSKFTLKGLSALSRIKNAVLDMMGFKAPEGRTVAAQFLDSADKILSYRPQDATLHPGRKIRAAKDTSAPNPKEPDLQKARSDVWQTTKAIFAPKGVEPRVSVARERMEGEYALGQIQAIQAQNRLAKVVTTKNSKDVNAALSGDSEALSRLTPEARKVVTDTIARHGDLVIQYAKAWRDNPKATPQDIAHVHEALAAGGKFQTETFQASVAPKAMKGKFQLAQRAQKKIDKGVELSTRERKAVDDLNSARKYLLSKWFPEKLDELPTEDLERLYSYHVGQPADKALANVPKADRRNTLINAVGQAVQDNAHKAGAIDNILKSAMNLTDRNDRLRTFYNALRKRAEMGVEPAPDALRNLWGVVEEPGVRVAQRTSQLYEQIGRQRSLQQLRDQGLGTLFSEKPGASPDHTHQIYGSRFGALQGLWTTPDVARTLQSSYAMNFLTGRLVDAITADTTARSLPYLIGHSLLGKAWTTTGQTYKLVNVVGSLGRYVLNAIGSPMQAMSNGNINPVHWARGMKLAAESIGTSLKQDMSPMLKDMFRYRQLEYSWIQELKGSEHANQLASLMKQAADSNDPLRTFKDALGKLNRGRQITGQIAKELYGSMDIWSKYANWFHHLETWTGYDMRTNDSTKALIEKYGEDNVRKALIGYSKDAPQVIAAMTPADRKVVERTSDAIKTKVAERNNDMNITPSRAPAFIRGAESVRNNYLTYFSEIPRTLGYAVYHGLQDARTGLGLGKGKADAQLAMHGIMQLAGTAAAVYGMRQFTGYLYNTIAGKMGLVSEQLDDNDPRKKYIQNDPYLSSMAPMLFKDPDHPEAGTYIVDVNGPDPYAPITDPLVHKPVEILQKLMAGDKKGAGEILETLGASVKGMLLRDPVLRASENIWNAKAPNLKKTNESLYNDWMAAMMDKGMSIDTANRLLDTMEFVLPGTVKAYLEASGVKEKSERIAKTIAAGIGTRRFDVAEDLTNYLGGKAASDINAARASYMRLLKADFPISDDQVEDAFKTALERAGEPYIKLQDAVYAAKAQDVEDEEIAARLKTAGISKKMIAAILNGDKLTPLMILGDLKTDMKKDLLDNYNDDDSREKAKDRYIKNEERLINLVQKYQENQ
jgi:hypothetical protein